MKPLHEFTARPRRFTSLRRLFLAFCAVTVFAVACPGCGDSPGQPVPGPEAKANLPEISAFLTKPSDRFLVDIEDISRGHPLLATARRGRAAGIKYPRT